MYQIYEVDFKNLVVVSKQCYAGIMNAIDNELKELYVGFQFYSEACLDMEW